MTFEEESIKNRLLIDANLNSNKFNIYNLTFETNYQNFNFEESKNFQKSIIENTSKLFDICQILEENKSVFHLTCYPDLADNDDINYKYSTILAILRGENPKNFHNKLDFRFYYFELIKIALFKWISQLDNIEGSFNLNLGLPGRLTFYMNESKEAALQLENEIYKFFDEISPHTDNYELKVTFKKEILSPNKYSHLDMLGNEIKIGDIGVGCSGRGSTQGLEIQQILSMSKVLINGNLRPSNFIVLKPIDGRPIKGV